MIKVDVFIQEEKWKKYIVNPQKYLNNKTNKIRNLIPLIKTEKVVFLRGRFIMQIFGSKKVVQTGSEHFQGSCKPPGQAQLRAFLSTYFLVS